MVANGQAPSHEMTVEWTRRSVQTSSKTVQKDLQQVVDLPSLDEKSLTQAEQVTMLPSKADENFAKLKASTEE